MEDQVRSAPPRRAPRPPERAETLQLGDVVRETLDHVRVIVRDGVAIGKLEAREVSDRVTKDIAPRALIGLGAAAIGVVGATLTLIAIFLGFGVIVASVAWRLFIFGIAFLGVAALAGYLASRPMHRSVAAAKRLALPDADGRALEIDGGRRAASHSSS